jgi:hypothetical protein
MQQNVLGTFQDITVSTIYLMGSSFILGSLFTMLLLLLLDFMRRNTEKRKKP